MKKQSEEKLYGGVLIKAIAILDFLQAAKTPQSTTDICKGTSLNKATASKILQTMQALELVTRDEMTQQYVIGTRLIGYGQSAMEQFSFEKAVLPFMTQLRDETGETIHLGIRSGLDMLYLNKKEAINPVRLRSRIGGMTPLHTSAMGKALLAASDDQTVEAFITACDFQPYTPNTITDPDVFRQEIMKVRELGYSEDNEEFEEGVSSRAIAITSNRKVYGAMSVSVPVYRLTPELTETILSALLATKERISGSLT